MQCVGFRCHLSALCEKPCLASGLRMCTNQVEDDKFMEVEKEVLTTKTVKVIWTIRERTVYNCTHC